MGQYLCCTTSQAVPKEEQKEAVGLVMDFGKPDVNAVNNEGKTALDIATEKNDESLVKFLLKYD